MVTIRNFLHHNRRHTAMQGLREALQTYADLSLEHCWSQSRIGAVGARAGLLERLLTACGSLAMSRTGISLDIRILIRHRSS
ncbi:MAG: hypothetical protein OXF73_02375 [Gammaproteobacteria bacterium]|nr:hypothetical protein [Gammaproteobacteria bacterium]MCY4228831.1 hypothetical protein [Gammaproteobacteria bacterium]